MSLITAYEVLRHSPAGPTYPTGQFCELIPHIEEELARECLGPLYEYLVSKLAVYPKGVTEWSDCGKYNIGDKVVAWGCTFVSLVNYNTADPLSENTDWQAYERFTDSAANAFWARYLRRLLALKVYLSSLTFETFQTGPTGIIVRTGGYSNDIRSGNKGELFEVKQALQGEINRLYENMTVWLKKEYKTAGFPTPNICLSNVCEKKIGKSRRFLNMR